MLLTHIVGHSWWLETWVRSLSWKDPLEKEKATHSSILAWRTVRGVTESRTRLSAFLFLFHFHTVIVSMIGRMAVFQTRIQGPKLFFPVAPLSSTQEYIDLVIHCLKTTPALPASQLRWPKTTTALFADGPAI